MGLLSVIQIKLLNQKYCQEIFKEVRGLIIYFTLQKPRCNSDIHLLVIIDLLLPFDNIIKPRQYSVVTSVSIKWIHFIQAVTYIKCIRFNETDFMLSFQKTKNHKMITVIFWSSKYVEALQITDFSCSCAKGQVQKAKK